MVKTITREFKTKRQASSYNADMNLKGYDSVYRPVGKKIRVKSRRRFFGAVTAGSRNTASNEARTLRREGYRTSPIRPTRFNRAKAWTFRYRRRR